ncbi:hypothetical protein R3X27_07090 [Tropicimonas sp. TH_r6]|uniref:hypothetical protein n=1 Tax=Tropicimonas sp. TH_r6 TaxID=3082085 RepID=UPI002954E2A6|nr:hypothetical protein [Tropicimonas sp. TH_r6]MDV7142445.1 hypothetical protein [Tropicimonas sp. TH_r6]
MTVRTGSHPPLGHHAQTLLRCLVASYFLAGAIGLFPGIDLLPLTERTLPASFAGPISATSIFLLAYMIMVGIWLRGAALLLGILTFWASYLRMMEQGMGTDLGVFWRDLALIGALMLTYSRSRGNILLQKTYRPELNAPNLNSSQDRLSMEEMEELFQEDFEHARTG